MTITRIAQQAISITTNVNSQSFSAIDVQVGDLIVVKWACPYNRYITGISDGTNTYAEAVGYENATAPHTYGQIWYAIVTAANASLIVDATVNGTINVAGIFLEQYRTSSGSFSFDSANKQAVSTPGSSTTQGVLDSAAITESGSGLISALVCQDNGYVTNWQFDNATVVGEGGNPTDIDPCGVSGENIFSSGLSGVVIGGNIGGNSTGGAGGSQSWTVKDLFIAPFTVSGGGGGALAGTADLAFAATGTLKGSGALAAAANLALGATGTIKGSGALSGAAGLALGATGTLAGKAAAVGTAALTFAASGVLAGAGALAGSAGMSFGTSGTLTGAGALAGTAPLTISATATPSGSGALAGTADLVLSATGTATGPSGSISGTADLSFGSTGTLTGSGSLSGAAPLSLGAAGTLTGSGALSGSAGMVFTAVARPNGSSALAGSANLTFGATGTLTGLAPIGGSASLAFTDTGTLQGRGALAGVAGMVLTAQATPSAKAAISGTANLTFYATGTLTNGLPSYPADGWYYIHLPPRFWYTALPARPFYVKATPMPAQYFSDKDSRESVVLTLDATADLASGETLTAITATDVTVIAGQDPSPASILGNPVINSAAVTVTLPNGQTVTVGTGKGVQVEAMAGIPDVSYLTAFTCTTSNPDKILVLKGVLPVTNS